MICDNKGIEQMTSVSILGVNLIYGYLYIYETHIVDGINQLVDALLEWAFND